MGAPKCFPTKTGFPSMPSFPSFPLRSFLRWEDSSKSSCSTLSQKKWEGKVQYQPAALLLNHSSGWWLGLGKSQVSSQKLAVKKSNTNRLLSINHLSGWWMPTTGWGWAKVVLLRCSNPWYWHLWCKVDLLCYC